MEWESLGLGVLANVIFGIGSFLCYVIFVRIRNQRLIEFWNLGEHRALRVYLSRLQVQRGGSYGSAEKNDQPHVAVRPAEWPDLMDLPSTGSTSAILPSGEVYRSESESKTFDDHVWTSGPDTRSSNQFAQRPSQPTPSSDLALAAKPHTRQSVARNYEGDAVPKLEHEIAEDLVRSFYSAVGDQAGTSTLSSGLLRVHADAEIINPANK